MKWSKNNRIISIGLLFARLGLAMMHAVLYLRSKCTILCYVYIIDIIKLKKKH